MAESASPTATLADQVRRLAHGYVRHGAKANRRQQLGCAITVVEWIAARERFTGLHQIGKRHGIDFWRARRQYGLCLLAGFEGVVGMVGQRG